jgi:hypothetical protein
VQETGGTPGTRKRVFARSGDTTCVQVTHNAVAAGVHSVAPNDERAFFTELDAVRDRVVPVVGAGMAIEPGVPGVWALRDALLDVAGGAWVSAHPELTTAELFDVADALAALHSEQWVQEQVVAILKRQSWTSTPPLKALAKVASRLIVTTNYDLAIEDSARAVGQPVESYTLDDFDLALQHDGALKVLHLHGSITKPVTIVLTSGSYSRILTDERAQLVMRDLAVRFRLLFLGHSLAANEVHIRRDVLWATRLAHGIAVLGGRHLLVTSEAKWDAGIEARWGEVHGGTGVRVFVFRDPDSEFLAA